MGTNYYVKKESCPTCGHKEEQMHIGKSSLGWKFLFRFRKGEIENIEDLKKILWGKHIVDEYGKDISQADFFLMVERKQGERNSGDMLIGGYEFLDNEFS